MLDPIGIAVLGIVLAPVLSFTLDAAVRCGLEWITRWRSADLP
jgi:hypothetical protein